MTAIDLAIVDDHRVVGRSLAAYLESFQGLRVVGRAVSGEDLLAHLDEWKPDIVLQDLLLPGGLDGVEVTRRILQRRPSTRVIALTASVDEARMTAVLRAGALGYVRKDAEPETLLAAIRAVASGRTFLDPAAARAIAGSADEDDLTPRERDVLRALAFGQSNRVISEGLGISEETVKTHVAHILAKLQVVNRGQAMVAALRRGLVSLDELGRP